MKFPNTLEIKEKISKRVFNAKYKSQDVVLKLFTPDDLDGCAAQIKHVFDEHEGTDCDYLETSLDDRVLYCIRIHYLIQRKLGISMTSEYYCKEMQEWVFETILDDQNDYSESSLPVENECRAVKDMKNSFIQLIHVFGVRFDQKSQVFTSQDQFIGLIFPKLGQPLMNFTQDQRWVPNPIYHSSVFSDELSIAHIFKDVVKSVLFLLKELNIVHKDIKIENICTGLHNPKSNKIHPVIIDFGESQILSNNGMLRDAYGTHTMLPPEAFTYSFCSHNDKNYMGYSAEKREVWTLGCLLHTLVFGYPPYFGTFSKKSPIEFQLKLCDESINIDIPTYSSVLNADISHNLRNLLSNVLVKAPNNRFCLENILLHPWFQP
ncbi:Protein kinase domain protein [Cryptosporidium meleagridis]|uniref:Protein kinase domain protein n=1 Tax=Cryptosporidium meleagridis TaxID=93969 RepID=A0A2P4Z6E1_9CRYT|nr:Protein kinase domain protein [Cryptosporidium meleagridis]